MRSSIDILLATYNGALYLPDQLRSIEQQTYSDWRLIVRDDGSTDETREILARFKAKHGDAVLIVGDVPNRLGICGNFNLLMGRSTAPYSVFCDQDDLWNPRKLEILFVIAENKERNNQPLLIHSDLEVVDAELSTISPSLWQYQKIDPRNCSWNRLLVQNVVTGCACFFNARLREMSIPVPQAAIMHDWWIALVAAWSGAQIFWHPEPLVRYRQHGRNDTGAKKWGARYVIQNYNEFFRGQAFISKLRLYQSQALALLDHADGKNAGGVLVLEGFSRIHEIPRLKRVGFLLRNNILKTGFIRNAAMLARI